MFGFLKIIYYLRLSLIHVAQFHFSNKADPFLQVYTYTFSHIILYLLPKEWLDIGPCAKPEELYAYPLHGPLFGCITLQIPVQPTASPSNLATQNLFSSPWDSFLSKGSLVSFARFQIEGVSNGVCLSFLDILCLVWEFFVYLWLPMALSLLGFMAEYSSTVYMDILFLIQPSVHGHRMRLNVLLLWRVLHKHGGAFHFLKRTFSGHMPKSGIAGSFSHTMFMFQMT